MLHAHIGSGPQYQELHDNLTRLAAEFVELLKKFPQVNAISLGGGIPHNYKDHGAQVPIEPLHDLFVSCHQRLVAKARRDLRLEIEPGRYYVAPGCTLVARVTDVKQTRSNEKGSGATFAMVDAGFVDLVRPAMYGSYHAIDIVGRDDEDRICRASPSWWPVRSARAATSSPATIANCSPRGCCHGRCRRPAHPARRRRYGYAMASNYNSIGRAPQLWLEEDGSVEIISRRETIDDLLKAETSEPLP